MSDLDGSPPHPDARHLHGRQAAAQAASYKTCYQRFCGRICGCDSVKEKWRLKCLCSPEVVPVEIPHSSQRLATVPSTL